MKLENIMISERSWIKKVIYCVILFIEYVQNRLIHRDRTQMSGCQGIGERGEWKITA